MKQLLFFAIWVNIAISAFTIEFTVAPLYFIDETTEQVNPRNNFQERILLELGKASTEGKLRFKGTGISRYNPPQSVGDAITLCRAEKANYLIYGFITRKEQVITGELRLLDFERKEVVASFFAMDNNDREDAFIRDLVDKLFRFLSETYDINIITEAPVYTYIQVPFSAGYWVLLDSNMADLMTSIIRVDTGIQVIPRDRLFVVSGSTQFFSIGVGISYRLGQGKNYESWSHGFTLCVPVQFNLRFHERYETFIGFGALYSMDLLQIQKPYEDPVMEIYHAAGIMFNHGWTFRLGKRVFFLIQAKVEIQFYENPVVDLIPSIGIIIRGNAREVQKW